MQSAQSTMFTAAALSAFCLLIFSLTSAEGYYYWRRRSFIATPFRHLHESQYLNVRGGSSSTVDDIAENDAADNALDDIDIKSATTSDEPSPTPRNLTFPATTPHDGHDVDPDGIPSRFLQMKKDNRDEAKESWQAHLNWRLRYGVDTILSRPHALYDVCKAQVPHYFSGRDPRGNVVFVQRPAKLDFELMRRNNATMEDLLRHYVCVIEYCWNILDPSPPERVMTNILDMKGLSFRNLRNQEYISFGKQFVQMMSSNYPGRSYKTLIINAPSWFHALYKMFQPILRESTRQKIVILKSGERQDTALKFYLGDSLPRDLLSSGGSEEEEEEQARANGERYFIPVEDVDECEPGPNSMIEFEMRQFFIEQLAQHNETMQEVV